MFILLIIAVWIIFEITFYCLTYKKALTQDEIKRLMNKRRKKHIKKYYNFKQVNSFPYKEFKSNLKASGMFYPSNIELLHFPSYVANLLKGKKHEWVVFGFVRDNMVVSIYANKGYDKTKVAPNIDANVIIQHCRNLNCQTVMRFHNHPNSDPKHYTGLLASKQDKISANYFSEQLIRYNINWLDFVCERGRFIEFYRSFSNNSFPGNSNYYSIYNQNQDRKQWYRLHRELYLKP